MSLLSVFVTAGSVVHEQTPFVLSPQNALEYPMSLNFMNGKIQGLIRAIRGE